MEGIVDKVTVELCKAFKEFILAVEYRETVESRVLALETNSLFLNFNYTDTIERYYYVKRERILYIHGNAKIPGDNIILGHGVDPKNFEVKEKEPPPGLGEEELDMWQEQMSNDYDYSYESGKSKLMSYFLDSFKSTTEIIQNHRSFFDKPYRSAAGLCFRSLDFRS